MEFEFEDTSGQFSDAAHAGWLAQHGDVFVEHESIPHNTKILAMDDHRVVLSDEVTLTQDVEVRVSYRAGDFPATSTVTGVSGTTVTFADAVDETKSHTIDLFVVDATVTATVVNGSLAEFRGEDAGMDVEIRAGNLHTEGSLAVPDAVSFEPPRISVWIEGEWKDMGPVADTTMTFGSTATKTVPRSSKIQVHHVDGGRFKVLVDGFDLTSRSVGDFYEPYMHGWESLLPFSSYLQFNVPAVSGIVSGGRGYTPSSTVTVNRATQEVYDALAPEFAKKLVEGSWAAKQDEATERTTSILTVSIPTLDEVKALQSKFILDGATEWVPCTHAGQNDYVMIGHTDEIPFGTSYREHFGGDFPWWDQTVFAEKSPGVIYKYVRTFDATAWTAAGGSLTDGVDAPVGSLEVKDAAVVGVKMISRGSGYDTWNTNDMIMEDFSVQRIDATTFDVDTRIGVDTKILKRYIMKHDADMAYGEVSEVNVLVRDGGETQVALPFRVTVVANAALVASKPVSRDEEGVTLDPNKTSILENDMYFMSCPGNLLERPYSEKFTNPNRVRLKKPVDTDGNVGAYVWSNGDAVTHDAEGWATFTQAEFGGGASGNKFLYIDGSIALANVRIDFQVSDYTEVLVPGADRWSATHLLKTTITNQPPVSLDVTVETSGKGKHYFSTFDFAYSDPENFEVVVSDATGAGAILRFLEIRGVVQSVVIDAGGSGYTSPTASIAHPVGNGASITLTQTDGVIDGATVVTGGENYEPIMGKLVVETLPTQGFLGYENRRVAAGDTLSDVTKLYYKRNLNAIEADSFTFRVEDTGAIPSRSVKAYTVTIKSVVEHGRSVLGMFEMLPPDAL